MSELFSERSRIRAYFVNQGAVSLEAADARLESLCATIAIDRQAAASATGQAAFLTAVVTASRAFNRVVVCGALDAEVMTPLPLRGATLAERAADLGAHVSEDPEGRVISIGPTGIAGGWVVQATWDGWTAGVRPGSSQPLAREEGFVLSGVAAGALAVGQAFFAECGDLLAGRREQRLSIWDPCGLDNSAPDPRDLVLPSALWLIGLGNLGQAILWSLAALPYARPKDVLLFVQDDDTIDPDNWGTSILVRRGEYGALKTRAAEDWGLARGFNVRRVDRRVDAHQQRGSREPNIALAGVDRIPARRLLGGAGFDYIVDAGLGASARSYQQLRVNVFDKSLDPAAHFAGVEDETARTIARLKGLPAYAALAAQMNDGGCGAALLAEKSVAVPFVSAVAGVLAVVQAIRLANGCAPYRGITADLADLRTLSGALGSASGRPDVGWTPICAAPRVFVGNDVAIAPIATNSASDFVT